MFIKQFDMLSPPITLNYKGESKHSSIFSAILTLIAYSIILAAGIYYALIFINKESPTAYFFNRHVDDAGIFPVNASSMFNFLQLYKTDGSPVPTDFNKIEIIGTNVDIDSYVNDRDLSKYNHWIYGQCNNDSDTEGISYLIDQDSFTECACIRKYYDKETKQYYDSTDKNFKWPSVQHGSSNPNVVFYGVFMKKCENTELRKKYGETCSSKEEIDKYLEHTFLIFRIIDHYADVLDYKKPFTKYIYAISSGIFEGSYTINHLNFNPALMQTHNGIFFDNIVEEPAYFFTLNEKITSEVGDTTLIQGFYFWMQNVQQYYEREYKRLQDILSDIGGIGSITLMIAEVINLLISNFILLLDTEQLFLNIGDNYKNKDIKPNNNISKSINEMMCPPKKNNNNNDNMLNNSKQSSNYERMNKEEINIVKKSHINNNDIGNNKILFLKKNESLGNFLKKKFKIQKENTRNIKENENYNNDNNEIIINIYSKSKENNESNKESNYNKELYDSIMLNQEQNTRQFNSNNKIKNKWTNSEIKIFNSERVNLPEDFIQKDNKKDDNNKNLEKKNSENLDNNSKSKKSDIDDKKDNNKKNIEKENKFNWFNFLCFLLSCSKSNPVMKYYEDLRVQIISEENMIKNHLYIHKSFDVSKDNSNELLKVIKRD